MDEAQGVKVVRVVRADKVDPGDKAVVPVGLAADAVPEVPVDKAGRADLAVVVAASVLRRNRSPWNKWDCCARGLIKARSNPGFALPKAISSIPCNSRNKNTDPLSAQTVK